MRMTLLCAVLLTGCATPTMTPREIVKSAPVDEAVSSKPPEAFMQCVRTELLNETDWRQCLPPQPEMVKTDSGSDLWIQVPIMGTVGVLSAVDREGGSSAKIFAVGRNYEHGPFGRSCERLIRYRRAIDKCG